MSDSERGRTPPAVRMIGANPRGAVGQVSLAVRGFLRQTIPSGDESRTRVLIAVSGGADSTALAVAAVDVCARRGIECRALTVDHGLREASDDEARAVAARLGSWGADARVVRVDAAPRPGAPEGPEAAARRARRAALLGEALRFAGAGSGSEAGSGAGDGRASGSGPEGASRTGSWSGAHSGADATDEGGPGAARRVLVLLGHTMDDQAETVLLRLARGSGVGSLRAMDALTEWIPGSVLAGRPLLGVRRAQTRACCEQLGVEWVEDPTNDPDGPWTASDGSALRRAAVRARALPALAEALGVDPVPALARTAALAARDDDALDAQAERLWAAAVHEDFGEPDQDPARERGRNDGSQPARRRGRTIRCDGALLAQAPPAIRDRVLRRAILAAGGRPGDVTAGHVARVAALIVDWHGQGAVDLPGATAWRPAGAPTVVLTPRPAASGR